MVLLSEEKDRAFRGENRARKKRETEMAGHGDLRGPVARPGMRKEEASGVLATCWSGAGRDRGSGQGTPIGAMTAERWLEAAGSWTRSRWGRAAGVVVSSWTQGGVEQSLGRPWHELLSVPARRRRGRQR